MKRVIVYGAVALVAVSFFSSCGTAKKEVTTLPPVVKEREDYSKLLAPYRKQLEIDYGRFLKEARAIQNEYGD